MTTLPRYQLSLLDLFAIVTVSAIVTWAAIWFVQSMRIAFNF